eukprot:5951116-Pyramimonas_sp.AAC.1
MLLSATFPCSTRPRPLPGFWPWNSSATWGVSVDVRGVSVDVTLGIAQPPAQFRSGLEWLGVV